MSLNPAGNYEAGRLYKTMERNEKEIHELELAVKKLNVALKEPIQAQKRLNQAIKCGLPEDNQTLSQASL